MSNPFHRKARVPAPSPEKMAQVQAARRMAMSMDRWNHTTTAQGGAR
jgi:hypothetical protein